ncbi:cellulose binding domain-containing protein [Plantactinospora soyae]|uniref:Chitodextrinase n=1 Tax=Plantactinospora soyae TaxID=1544732 RepID=A0A927QVJ9_9ACTN|nr:cellulose binding domain-containing protein [Plantactinospora soyae]MBE1485820.1 chitodextrinase [Plantactinospora soyae]
MHSRPSRPARWWARTLILPVVAAALIAGSGTAAYAAAEDTEPPSTPGPITVVDTTANSVLLTWAASTDNVAVASYQVSQIFTDIGIMRSTPTNSILITGVLPSRTYTFGVWAVDAAGNRSTAPPSLRFTMPPGDSQPPTAPAALAVRLVGETSVSLGWSPSTDNVLLAQYEVLSIAPAGNTVVARVPLLPPAYPSTSASVAGLTPGTTYTFAVRALDEAGNYSALSDPVTVTTGRAPEPTPACTARYRTVSQWPGGSQVELVITNTGPAAISGWTLVWSFPSSQRIVSIWGAALVSQTEGTVTVRDVRHNATIRPGGTVAIGYVARGSAVPTAFALNGQSCRAG